MKQMSYLTDFIYLVIYDIHFGHRKNKTADIIKTLESLLHRNRDSIASMKTIFFTGDIFDRLIPLSSTDSILVLMWFNRFLEFCIDHDLQVRILEGTPLHDRGQSEVLALLGENKQVDIKYINSLHIEHNTVLDKTILYIPDEWTDSAEKLEEEILTLMSSLSLEQVDLGIVHGLFEYQLPSHIPNLLRLSEDFFNRIVKGLIHIGHIHTFNPRGRIIPGGSFDRLAHNEEEDKGAIAVSEIDGDYTYEFLVNNEAKTFITLDVSEYQTVNDLLAFLDKALKELREGSHVRLYFSEPSSVMNELATLKKRYNGIYFTRKVGSEVRHVITTEDIVSTKDLPVINKNTIETIFAEYVEEHPSDTPGERMVSILKHHLNELKESE